MTPTNEQPETQIANSMFYNAQFNYGCEMGGSKFVYGISSFDLLKPLKEQILAGGSFELDQVFNFNLTAFNHVFVEGDV